MLVQKVQKVGKVRPILRKVVSPSVAKSVLGQIGQGMIENVVGKGIKGGYLVVKPPQFKVDGVFRSCCVGPTTCSMQRAAFW